MGVPPAQFLRHLVWWLPVTLLGALDLSVVSLVAAGLAGTAARLREDRRSPLGLLAGTRTVTRSALVARRRERSSSAAA